MYWNRSTVPTATNPIDPTKSFVPIVDLLSIEAFQDTLEEQNKMDMQSQELMEWKEKMEILLNEPDTFIQMLQEGRGKTK